MKLDPAHGGAMTTITLNLPDDLAATLAAMPDDERNHFAIAALSAAIEQNEEAEWTLEELAALAGPLTPEDLASIARGLAEADAGMGRPADEFFAELRQELMAGDINRRGR
jgi:predicted transcriptional regulator